MKKHFTHVGLWVYKLRSDFVWDLKIMLAAGEGEGSEQSPMMTQYEADSELICPMHRKDKSAQTIVIAIVERIVSTTTIIDVAWHITKADTGGLRIVTLHKDASQRRAVEAAICQQQKVHPGPLVTHGTEAMEFKQN